MSFSPQYFGRYLLLEPLASAWNAELYYAKLFGTDGGPDRVVVLKKVVAELADEDCARAFEQEIKITVALNHPNIVQTYDFGMVEGRYFMAMEYLPGPSLAALLARLAEQDLMCSAELSCHIVSQLGHALNYAHNFRDRVTGEARAVVHRDVSPEKIMITFEGAVKLIEFGMARMESHEHFTRVGAILGQPGYMSPERLFGDELDGRADVYSLGVVLWEMLAGRSFRPAGATLDAIRDELNENPVAPSAHNPAVPKRLDNIVLRATALQPGERFASVADFQRELHQFLYSHAPDFNPQDLTACIQELFRAEVDAEEGKFREFLKVAAPSRPAAPEKEVTLAAVDYAHVNTRTGIDRTGAVISASAFRERELEKLFVKNVQLHESLAERLAISKEAPSEVEFEGVPAELLSTRPAEVAPLKSVRMPAPAPLPPPAEAAPGSVPLTRPSRLPVFAAGAVLTLGLSVALLFTTETGGVWRRELAQNYISFSVMPEKRAVQVATGRMPAFSSGDLRGVDPTGGATPEPGFGFVLFEGDTFGFDLEVNGSFTPVVNNRISMPLGVPFKLRARKQGAEDINYAGQVSAADAPVRIRLNFAAQRPKGYLTVLAAAEMKVKIFEENTLVLEGKTPWRDAELPAGDYRLVFENALLGAPAEEAVRVEGGKRIEVNHSAP